jgi:ketoreductase
VRAALVSGASSGIGLALARLLAAEGHALTIGGRRPDRLEAAADELRAGGAEVVAVAGDLADGDAVAAMVEAHRRAHGRLDVLVNNAGVGVGQRLEEITDKHLDLQVGVNLRSTILFYREAAPLLRAAGAEHGNALVINTSSAAGRDGQPWLSVYSAVKAGVIAFTEAMNKELSGTGVKSCALCPATVDTPMTRYVDGERDWMVGVDDVAEAVRFLLRLSPACVVPELVLDNVARPSHV